MPELNLRNPLVFTAFSTVVWTAVWGLVQLLLFGEGVFVGAVKARLADIVFSALYRYPA